MVKNVIRILSVIIVIAGIFGATLPANAAEPEGIQFKGSSSGAYPYIENNGEIEILKRGEIC